MTAAYEQSHDRLGPFLFRALVLRQTWVERRLIAPIARRHDFRSQYGLLRLLHDWSGEAVADLRDAYGDDIVVSLSEMPEPGGSIPAFQLLIGEAWHLVVGLERSGSPDDPRWRIAASIQGPSGPRDGAGF